MGRLPARLQVSSIPYMHYGLCYSLFDADESTEEAIQLEPNAEETNVPVAGSNLNTLSLLQNVIVMEL